MLGEIPCKCSECGAELTFLPAYAGRAMPCPKCGSAVLVPDPDKEAEKRRHSKIWKVVQLVALVALCWGTTVYFGPSAVRNDVYDVIVPLKENFRSVKYERRYPLPFIISFRVKASGAKANYEKTVDSSQIVIDSTFTKYYVWFFRYKREMRFKSDPFFLSWVWLF
ncbi:MAG: hypothetical protein JXB04_04520 [Kiritimatiellae bacterium]|nr:hypothetical protein [Kiritimatiellia bacterium]